jgi:hypothetical protein
MGTMTRPTWLIVAAVLAGGCWPASADPTWAEIQAVDDWIEHGTREHDDAGTVVVWRTQLDEVYCFHGQATVDVDAELLLTVATDMESAMEWSSADVAEAETLSRSGGVIEYYQYLDVPRWTLSKDRFWFLRGRTVRTGGAITFVWGRLDEGGAHNARYLEVIEAHPDAIEVPVNSGAWVFEPDGDGTVVHYYVCSISGGHIPEKLGMMVTTTTLPDNIGDLVREGRRRSK